MIATLNGMPVSAMIAVAASLLVGLGIGLVAVWAILRET